VYTEVQKLDLFDDLQQHLDALHAAGVMVCYAARNTKLLGKDSVGQGALASGDHLSLRLRKGKTPAKVAVARKVKLGLLSKRSRIRLGRNCTK
jgi:hypothetical protein